MSVQFLECTVCGFKVPYDSIGVALMQQHVLDHRKAAEVK